jgi:integrase
LSHFVAGISSRENGVTIRTTARAEDGSARQERPGVRLEDGEPPLASQRRAAWLRRRCGGCPGSRTSPSTTCHHAYGSRLASKGLSARQIADALGHKKTSTTEIYIQRFDGEAADERVREAMSG